MRQYVEDATIGGMIEGGSVMVTRDGPCVLSMGIDLIDIDLIEPDGGGASTSFLSSWGSVTLDKLLLDQRKTLQQDVSESTFADPRCIPPDPEVDSEVDPAAQA